MGQHSKPSSRRRVVLVVLAALVVLVTGVGVRAAVQSYSSPRADPPTPAGTESPTESPTEPATTRRATSSEEPETVMQQRLREARPFPGKPEKLTGVRSESGLGSGLGDDAGDLADRAQDLIDGPAEEVPSSPVANPLSFVVSSFNVLGASHTGPRGNKPQYAPWSARMGAQLRLLRTHSVDVVGFQEFEAPQFHGFMKRTNGAWGVYPAMSLGRPHTRNSIAWRRDVWRLADYDHLVVPYFRGNRRPIPVILLTHRATGRQVHVINTHNPASSKKRGNNKRWRTEATRLQIAKIRSLRSRAPDVPVIVTGDFNERRLAYCRMRNAGMQAANPGGARRGCAPPSLMGIDWIFGTRDVDFSGYRRQPTGRASDHPMIVATATIR